MNRSWKTSPSCLPSESEPEPVRFAQEKRIYPGQFSGADQVHVRSAPNRLFIEVGVGRVTATRGARFRTDRGGATVCIPHIHPLIRVAIIVVETGLINIRTGAIIIVEAGAICVSPIPIVISKARPGHVRAIAVVPVETGAVTVGSITVLEPIISVAVVHPVGIKSASRIPVDCAARISIDRPSRVIVYRRIAIKSATRVASNCPGAITRIGAADDAVIVLGGIARVVSSIISRIVAPNDAGVILRRITGIVARVISSVVAANNARVVLRRVARGIVPGVVGRAIVGVALGRCTSCA